jgi:nicotinate-nucleotide--dimethylbenzimidazole phosphoribosyltransferase
MSRSDAERCLIEGAYIAQLISRQGVDVIGTGEMGIGNSTAAAAVVSALTGEPPEKTTGRGTGRTDAELEGKVAVVRAALEKNHPTAKDPVDVLAKVGGYEIGVLAGAILGASEARRPIVLDGFISGAAALVAAAICPIAKQFMIAGHLSPEPGHAITLKHLGLSPLLDLNMRLGEGTGAILAMQVVEAAAACLGEMATFEQAGVTDKG